MKPTLLAILAALLVAAGLATSGCGGGSDTTGETTAATVESTPGAAENGGNGNGKKAGGGGKNAGGEGSQGGNTGGGGKSGKAQNFNRPPTKKEVKAFQAPPGGDNSIQTYGTEPSESEEEEVVSTMRSFFRALASLDYGAICDGITASNRNAFQQLLKAKGESGDCTTILKGLLLKQSADEARSAANGVVYQVRIENGNAFVLFTPEGGTASYFVMKKEGDSWKSTGINAGSPLNPTAQPGE